MGNTFSLPQSLIPPRRRSPFDPSGDPNAQVNADWSMLPSSAYAPSAPSSPSAPTVDPYQPAPSMPVQSPQPQDPRIQQLQGISQQLTDAYAPRKVGVGHEILGALVGGITKNPQLGGLVTGDTQRALQIKQLTGQQQAISGELTTEANVQNVQSEAAFRAAQAQKLGTSIPVTTADGRTIYLDEGDAAKYLGTQETSAGKVQAVQAGKRFISVPNVGLFDTQTKTVVPGSQQGVTVTPEIQQDYGLPADFLGKPMTLSNLSSLERAQNQQTTVVQGSAGPSLVNKRTAETRNLGLGAPAMSGIVPVAADPNNPGNITYAPKTAAVAGGMATPQSAPTQAAKSTLKSATSGPIGAQTTAFNTMIQHAQLLKQALAALNNGDTRALNSIKNEFKTQFGSPDVTNFNTIANAYNHEVTNVIAKGHMTDAEVKQGGASIPSNASPAQINGAIDAYLALANSKMNMLHQQVQQGMRGQTNFPAQQSSPPPGATHIVPGPDGKNHYTNAQGTVDLGIAP